MGMTPATGKVLACSHKSCKFRAQVIHLLAAQTGGCG